MRLKRKHKIILFVLALGIVLYCSSQWIINYFLDQYLPEIIKEKNDSPYDLTYQSVHYSLAERKLTVKGIEIQPKASQTADSISYIKGTLKQINIQQVAIWNLIKRHNLTAQSIAVIHPDIEVFQTKTVADTLKKDQPQFIKSIDIQEIIVNQAHLAIRDVEQDLRIQEIYNFNAELKGIHMGVETQDKPIPFTYKDYVMSCDSMYSLINNNHRLKIGSIQINQDQINTSNLSLQPLLELKEKSELPPRLLSIEAPALVFKGTDWGYKNQTAFYLHIDSIKTPAVRIAVQENTASLQKPKEKTVKSPKLFPFDLSIDKIAVDGIHLNSLEQWIVEQGGLVLHRIKNQAQDRLHVGGIHIHTPKIRQQQHNKPQTKTPKQVIHFDDLVQIDTLAIHQGSFTATKGKSNAHLLQTKAIDALVEDIRIDAHTLTQTIPFAYRDLSFSSEELQWNTGRFYDLKIGKIQGKNTNLTCSDFELMPKYGRKKMVSMFKYADDIFTIKTKSIVLDNYNWGFDKQDVLFVKADKIRFDQVQANIFRDKTPEFNMSIKPLFSKKLREIPFTLAVQKVQIANSTLEYEEYDQKAVAPGKLTFGSFNAVIQNVYSGYQQTKLPTTTIAVDARFMNAAPLHVDWSFNILNRSDAFHISGTIQNFPADAMQPFLQPYVKASTEGKLDLVKFNFSGNNKVATGTFAMNYHDLKVNLYRKNGEKKRKILSKVGNWFIHKNSAGELKQVEIKKVNRIEEKSFFNYLWLCILQGLKQTIL
ncbi:hypothetical protein [Myroides sp. DF42-4-2]|uniref:hypothetical protein n=1 Tax=unclassified Myroides TaxID=2642485 RepID=UPI002575851B|nr:hypothetical protein [Myroides sp. DF42-4-2]MDM1406369.1 hypothetical protein [Myroides sp. DF42-4-2]